MKRYAVFFDLYYAKIVYGKMYPLNTHGLFLDEDNIYSYVTEMEYVITMGN